MSELHELADPLARRLQGVWQRDPSAPVFHQLLRLFWLAQEQRTPNRFTDGYEVTIMCFGGAEQCAAAEASRAAFEADLRRHHGSKELGLDHVHIMDGATSTYRTADERQQHWFHKGALADREPGKDGQTRISERLGLTGGLGGVPMDTPSLDAWVSSGSRRTLEAVGAAVAVDATRLSATGSPSVNAVGSSDASAAFSSAAVGPNTPAVVGMELNTTYIRVAVQDPPGSVVRVVCTHAHEMATASSERLTAELSAAATAAERVLGRAIRSAAIAVAADCDSSEWRHALRQAFVGVGIACLRRTPSAAAVASASGLDAREGCRVLVLHTGQHTAAATLIEYVEGAPEVLASHIDSVVNLEQLRQLLKSARVDDPHSVRLVLAGESSWIQSPAVAEQLYAAFTRPEGSPPGPPSELAVVGATMLAAALSA